MYQHIVLATDLRSVNKDINYKTRILADQFSAKLSLIHTIEPIPAYGNPGFVDLESSIIEEAKKQMTLLGEELSVPEEDQYIEFGSIKNEVLRVVEEVGADLIIVGSHGRHGLSRLLGSAASAIVHGAQCDVLTIRCKF